MRITPGKFKLSFLSDDEAEVVYRDNTELGASPYEYCPTCRKRGTYRYKDVEYVCDCAEQPDAGQGDRQ
jgi:hypothetical protein